MKVLSFFWAAALLVRRFPRLARLPKTAQQQSAGGFFSSGHSFHFQCENSNDSN